MSSTSIPRFLLPNRPAAFRTRALTPSMLRPQTRLASKSTKTKSSAQQSKPRVLEKPTKFNPPSHGSRLRSATPRNYPGPQLSAEEISRQSKKQYPNMMPTQGTFLHWFLTSRSIHIWITMGVLFSLAGFTFITNFKRTSKFADLLPPASDLFFHPINWTKQNFEVLRLHTAAVGAETAERRQRSVDDVAKRDMYRKAHGLDTEGFGGWTAKKEGELLGPAIGNENGLGQVQTAAGGVANDEDGCLQEHVQQQQLSKKPLRKWLGIW